MTEAEWESSTDPEAMLRHLRGRVPDRTLRLFAIACCRRIIGRSDSRRNRLLLALAEEYLNVPADAEQDSIELACMSACHNDADEAALGASAYSAAAVRGTALDEAGRETAFLAERAAQAVLLRELVGRPPGLQ